MQQVSWLTEPSRARKRIIFARHGEYECNVRKVCNCDPREPYGLTELGQSQALALGEQLRGEGIELIVTSEFPRARQTAWLANRALNVPHQLVNRLANENRVGHRLEGKTQVEYFDTIRHDPVHAFNADGGESFFGLKTRVRQLIADLLISSPETILVVSHGWPLQAVRSLKGETSDHDAAMCTGMPRNCETVEWVGTLADLPSL